MPKKKKKTEEEKPEMIVETEKIDFGMPFEEKLEEVKTKEPKVEEKPKTNLVTVTVVKGSLVCDGVRYVKGETFQATRERALSIDPQFVEIHS